MAYDWQGNWVPDGAPAAPTGTNYPLSPAAMGWSGTKQDAATAARTELANQGYDQNAIDGILANVRHESGFNPNLRHPDQPHWGGEAHYAHGLYQEGGQEWNNYVNWGNQQYGPQFDWTDPTLQTRFLASRLQSPDYAHVNNVLMNPNASGVQKAGAFTTGYLKPAANYMQDRLYDFNRNGLGDVTGDGTAVNGGTGTLPQGGGRMADSNGSMLGDVNQYLRGGDQSYLNNALQAINQGSATQLTPIDKAAMYLMSLGHGAPNLGAFGQDGDKRAQLMMGLLQHQDANRNADLNTMMKAREFDVNKNIAEQNHADTVQLRQQALQNAQQRIRNVGMQPSGQTDISGAPIPKWQAEGFQSPDAYTGGASLPTTTQDVVGPQSALPTPPDLSQAYGMADNPNTSMGSSVSNAGPALNAVRMAQASNAPRGFGWGPGPTNGAPAPSPAPAAPADLGGGVSSAPLPTAAPAPSPAPAASSGAPGAIPQMTMKDFAGQGSASMAAKLQGMVQAGVEGGKSLDDARQDVYNSLPAFVKAQVDERVQKGMVSAGKRNNDMDSYLSPIIEAVTGKSADELKQTADQLKDVANKQNNIENPMSSASRIQQMNNIRGHFKTLEDDYDQMGNVTQPGMAQNVLAHGLVLPQGMPFHLGGLGIPGQNAAVWKSDDQSAAATNFQNANGKLGAEFEKLLTGSRAQSKPADYDVADTGPQFYGKHLQNYDEALRLSKNALAEINTMAPGGQKHFDDLTKAIAETQAQRDNFVANRDKYVHAAGPTPAISGNHTGMSTPQAQGSLVQSLLSRMGY